MRKVLGVTVLVVVAAAISMALILEFTEDPRQMLVVPIAIAIGVSIKWSVALGIWLITGERVGGRE